MLCLAFLKLIAVRLEKENIGVTFALQETIRGIHAPDDTSNETVKIENISQQICANYENERAR